MEDTKKYAVKAAKKYLEIRGYEFIGEVNDFLVCQCEDELVFVNVVGGVNTTEFLKSDSKTLMKEFERALLGWAIEHPDDTDYVITCDEVSVNIIRNDRALIRHIVNVLEAQDV